MAYNMNRGMQQYESRPMLVAIYDYHVNHPEGLSFSAGDHMELISEVGQEFVQVYHLSQNKIGMVQKLYVRKDETPSMSYSSTNIEEEPWFFKVARKDCDSYLLQEDVPLGTYIIRACKSDPNSFSLSVKNWSATFSFHVKHFQIKRTADNTGFYIIRTSIFPDIDTLIREYSHTPLKDCHFLTQPYDKRRLMESNKPAIDNLEVDKSEIKLIKILHEKKKVIWSGSWRNKVQVAVKVGNSENSMPEINMLKKLRHANIVTLLAFCRVERQIYTVLEYMTKDSLINFLKTNEGRELTIDQLNQIAIQIAEAMDYLGGMRIVHRNIGARNILVGENINVKLTEFSSARNLDANDIYKADEGARYAIKWTAIEALCNGTFSIKSDVWSFGIFLMELYTNGQVPYLNMNGQQVKEQLTRGFRMPKPQEIPNEIYDIIQECWKTEPKERPTFTYLKMSFHQVKIRPSQHDFDFDDDDDEDNSYLVMKPVSPLPSRSDFANRIESQSRYNATARNEFPMPPRSDFSIPPRNEFAMQPRNDFAPSRNEFSMSTRGEFPSPPPRKNYVPEVPGRPTFQTQNQNTIRQPTDNRYNNEFTPPIPARPFMGTPPLPSRR